MILLKLTVYLDVLIIVNIILNYCILKLTALFCGINVKFRNIIISSTVGALFSLSIFLEIQYICSFLLKFFSVIICSCLAFGIKNIVFFIKSTALMLVITFSFSGAAIALRKTSSIVYHNNFYTYLDIRPIVLLTAIVLVYCLITFVEFISFSFNRSNTIKVDIYYNNKSISVIGLYDTGFRVKDIITFRKVMICDYHCMKPLLQWELDCEIKDFYISGEYRSKEITPIFYSDISHNGILPAIKPDKVILYIGNKSVEIKNCIIAITEKNISSDIQVIFGKDIYSMAGI